MEIASAVPGRVRQPDQIISQIHSINHGRYFNHARHGCGAVPVLEGYAPRPQAQKPCGGVASRASTPVDNHLIGWLDTLLGQVKTFDARNGGERLPKCPVDYIIGSSEEARSLGRRFGVAAISPTVAGVQTKKKLTLLVSPDCNYRLPIGEHSQSLITPLESSILQDMISSGAIDKQPFRPVVQLYKSPNSAACSKAAKDRGLLTWVKVNHNKDHPDAANERNLGSAVLHSRPSGTYIVGISPSNQQSRLVDWSCVAGECADDVVHDQKKILKGRFSCCCKVGQTDALGGPKPCTCYHEDFMQSGCTSIRFVGIHTCYYYSRAAVSVWVDVAARACGLNHGNVTADLLMNEYLSANGDMCGAPYMLEGDVLTQFPGEDRDGYRHTMGCREWYHTGVTSTYCADPAINGFISVMNLGFGIMTGLSLVCSALTLMLPIVSIPVAAGYLAVGAGIEFARRKAAGYLHDRRRLANNNLLCTVTAKNLVPGGSAIIAAARFERRNWFQLSGEMRPNYASQEQVIPQATYALNVRGSATRTIVAYPVGLPPVRWTYPTSLHISLLSCGNAISPGHASISIWNALRRHYPDGETPSDEIHQAMVKKYFKLITSTTTSIDTEDVAKSAHGTLGYTPNGARERGYCVAFTPLADEMTPIVLPTVYNQNPTNELNATSSRIQRERLVSVKETWDEVDSHVRAEIPSMFTGNLEPLTEAQYLGRLTGCKRSEAEKTLRQCVERGVDPMAPTHNPRHVMFVKTEFGQPWQEAIGKNPRAIQSLDPLSKLCLAAYTIPWCEKVAEGFSADERVTYASGMTNAQIGALKHKKVLELDAVGIIEADYSRWDASLGSHAIWMEQRAFESVVDNELMVKLFKKLDKTSGSSHSGLTYTVDFTRHSGDPHTSVANSLLNGAIHLTIFDRILGKGNYWVIVLGDDMYCLVNAEGALRWKLREGEFRDFVGDLALRPEIAYHNNIHTGSFCSQFFYPCDVKRAGKAPDGSVLPERMYETCVLGPKPGRQLMKFGMSFNSEAAPPPTELNLRKRLAGSAASTLPQSAVSPGLRRFVAKALEHESRAFDIYDWQANTRDKHYSGALTLPPPSEICDNADTGLMVNMIYETDSASLDAMAQLVLAGQFPRDALRDFLIKKEKDAMTDFNGTH